MKNKKQTYNIKKEFNDLCDYFKKKKIPIEFSYTICRTYFNAYEKFLESEDENEKRNKNH